MPQRLAVLALLGFASGLPYLLTGTTLTARLADAHISLAGIGAFSLVALPYSLKPLWAPFLDRYRLPLGRRRGWLIVFQLALIGALALLAFAKAAGEIANAALAVAMLSASQDIVSDAYRTELLPPRERSLGTATYILGYRLAMVLSGGIALILADRIGWQNVYLVMASTLIVGVAVSALAPEPPPSLEPKSLGEAVFAPLVDYFRRPGALPMLALVTLYRAGDVTANVMVTPMLLELGRTKAEIGVVYKIVGLAATIVGALGGGALALWLGLYRALVIFAALQGLATASYGLLPLFGASRPLLYGVIGADQLCTGMSVAALDALLMSLCNQRFSATQFALLAAASGLAGRLLGGVSGVLAATLGWPLFFASCGAFVLPAIALIVRQRATVLLSRGP
jgi:PAT family beta-lactamase induction signal transducer AmpG